MTHLKMDDLDKNGFHDRRRFISRSIMGLASVSFSGLLSEHVACSKTTPSRPNILLIMVDDMGFSDLGCYGSEISTPNVDRLAEGGIRFLQFYNTARCCPTRASLLTGLYPHQAGMGGMVSVNEARPQGPYQGYLNDHCVTLAEVLHQAGYRTLMSGKWHVGEKRPHWPVDRGFEKYFGIISGGGNYFDIAKTKAPGVVRTLAINDQIYHPPQKGFYLTDAITEYAVKFLEESKDDDAPFFHYVAYTAPHWPLHAWPEDIEKYRGKYLKGWDALRQERYHRMIEMGIIDSKWSLTPRDEQAAPWSQVENKEEMDLKMAVYAAQIDRMDQGVGKILKTLRKINKLENTLVLFLSDNGGCAEGGPWGFDRRNNGLPPGGVDSYMSYGLSWANASNTPFRLYKHWVHEGGIATPLIAYWPSVITKGGRLTNQIGHVIDLMPTFIELARSEYPKSFKGKDILPTEGKSLVPILKGQKRSIHEYLFWEHEGNRAIRHGKWKLVSKWPEDWELFDLEDDRSEMNNLAAQHPKIVQQLEQKYREWAEKCGVKERH